MAGWGEMFQLRGIFIPRALTAGCQLIYASDVDFLRYCGFGFAARLRRFNEGWAYFSINDHVGDTF